MIISIILCTRVIASVLKKKMNSMHYISGNKISSAITKTAFTTTELYCITQVEMEIYELED